MPPLCLHAPLEGIARRRHAPYATNRPNPSIVIQELNYPSRPTDKPSESDAAFSALDLDPNPVI